MKKLVKYAGITILAVVSLTGLMTPARADTAPAPAPASTSASMAAPVPDQSATANEDKWTFNSPLYLWTPALTGTATLKGNNVRVDESFTDLKDHMDQGFMAYLELGKPEYGFYVNPNYFALSFSGHEGPIKANLDLDLSIIESVGYYRIWNYAGERPASLYVLGGVRYWNLHENLKTKVPIVGSSTVAETQWLVDPMVGFRFEEYITPRVHLMAQTDVGGFNLGTHTSRFSWQLMSTVGYDFTMPVIKKPSTVFAGWRQINCQWTSGSSTVNQNAINLNFSGILVGIDVHLF